MKKSDDEKAHIAAKQEQAMEPGKKATEYLDEGLSIILRSLGVDTDANVKQQQLDKGILIFDSDEVRAFLNSLRLAGNTKWEWLRPFFEKHDGYFIMDTAQPVAFVGDAGISPDGHIIVVIHDFREDREYKVRGIKMPKKEG
jgi:hypothetical protein